jgi:hypothetical protein
MLGLEWWVVYIGKFRVDVKYVGQKVYYSLVIGRSNTLFRGKLSVACA